MPYTVYKTENNKVKLFNLLNKDGSIVKKYYSAHKSWHRFVAFFGFENNKFCIYGLLEDIHEMKLDRLSRIHVFQPISEFRHCTKNDMLKAINKFGPHLLEGLEIHF